MTADESVEKYATLKSRVADLAAKRQLWEGRKEAHDANRVSILAELAAVGVTTTDLNEAKGVLQEKLANSLASLEKLVVEAEGKFVKLRSEHE